MFKPEYISFDCYGTLTRFRMSEMATEMFADRIKSENMEQFCKDFSAYRMDQVMGDLLTILLIYQNITFQGE